MGSGQTASRRGRLPYISAIHVPHYLGSSALPALWAPLAIQDEGSWTSRLSTVAKATNPMTGVSLPPLIHSTRLFLLFSSPSTHG